MALLILFSLVSGLATILAPCIWPVLPIILSSSIAGKGHKRPFGITLGVVLSFAIFTLTISTLVRLFNLDPNTIRVVAVVIIIFMGLTMVFPALYSKLEILITKIANIFGSKNYGGDGFLPGFLTGLSLGIVWSPCAGPILATIAALAASGKVNLDVILVTAAYIIGVGIPLFIFAYAGAKLITKLKHISKYTGRIQQVFGIVMILTAFAIFTNFDKTLQLRILDMFPALGTSVNGFENSNTVTNQLNILKGQSPVPVTESSKLFNTNIPSPDFNGITKWLNTDTPLTINDLKGKVVLVDFWTYTCINCIRTLPHITDWYDKYKDLGFIVIGIHTPEFQFEHDTNNVLGAIKMYNIHYPVAQDNNYTTWNAYANQYWPAEYLIDSKGKIRRTHFGEGEYDQTEMAIQSLLMEAGEDVSTPLADTPDTTPVELTSPESYLGTSRMVYYFPSGSVSNGINTFKLSDNLPLNSFSFGGEWELNPKEAIAGKDAVLNYNFKADKVYLVLKPGNAVGHAKIKVFMDGNPVDSGNAGSDVVSGMINVDTDKLYNLIDLKGKSGMHILRIEFEDPGIEAFAFTFG